MKCPTCTYDATHTAIESNRPSTHRRLITSRDTILVFAFPSISVPIVTATRFLVGVPSIERFRMRCAMASRRGVDKVLSRRSFLSDFEGVMRIESNRVLEDDAESGVGKGTNDLGFTGVWKRFDVRCLVGDEVAEDMWPELAAINALRSAVGMEGICMGEGEVDRPPRAPSLLALRWC